MADESNNMRECPFCKEEIQADATRCSHCGSYITPEDPSHGGECPYCKEEVDPEATKCKHCGSYIGPEKTVQTHPEEMLEWQRHPTLPVTDWTQPSMEAFAPSDCTPEGPCGVVHTADIFGYRISTYAQKCCRIEIRIGPDGTPRHVRVCRWVPCGPGITAERIAQ